MRSRAFNLITNHFNAEYGRNTNSQLQIWTTQGTRAFHGGMFEFLPNSFFNARDYFDRTSAATPNVHRDWGEPGRLSSKTSYFPGHLRAKYPSGWHSRRDRTDPGPGSQRRSRSRNRFCSRIRFQPALRPRATQVAPNATDRLAYSGRIDYNVSERDNLYLRFGEQSANAASTGNTFIDSLW
jgi:hypothetical protein